MDLGPVGAISPVSMIRPSPPGSETNPDLAGVFAVELRDHQGEDSYSPSHEKPSGLQDENADESSDAGSSSETSDSSETTINIFA